MQGQSPSRKEGREEEGEGGRERRKEGKGGETERERETDRRGEGKEEGEEEILWVSFCSYNKMPLFLEATSPKWFSQSRCQQNFVPFWSLQDRILSHAFSSS